MDEYLCKLSSHNVDPRESIDWGTVVGPFYTPELGIGIGVAAAGFYRPDDYQQNTPLSSLSLTGFGSSTGALGVGFENNTFLRNDQWRFYLNGQFSHRPLHYWGEGYSAGRNNHGKQSYNSRNISANPQILYRLQQHTYAGIGAAIDSQRATKLQHKASGSFYQHPVPLNELNVGVSVIFLYDTRDFPVNPTRGQQMNIRYTDYTPALGGDHHLTVWDMQYDLYHPINPTTLIAWDLYGRFAAGHVPWTMMGSLGDSHHLRGYYEGRYRERNAMTTQLELRKKLSWRHGVVAWVGAGSMSSRPSEVIDGRWLPSVGVGYRFEIKKRMNLRFDYGVGERSSGFYFQIGEAF
ncbi:BamA/TamA family outer membrane protein [Erwinia sorbitola]|uniref:BamA/TamA family outer membrane protein n=1 Tax=Erwinia sorbitola TaxID=2681984 RepID=UPI001E2C300F|nr:BamA/TamA family outer membrane protein [Erwinia sorbitola]